MIAVISAGATATFMSGVAIPLVTGHLSSQVELLRTTVSAHTDTIRDLNSRLDNSAKAFSEQRAELEAARARERSALVSYREARLKNPFSVGVPYPRGLEKLRIGNVVSKIKEDYPKAELAPKHGRWYSVEDSGNPLVRTAVYYFPSEDKQPRIDNILYFFNQDHVSSGWLLEQLVAALGSPVEDKKENIFYWSVAPNLTVRHEVGAHTFSVGLRR